MPEANYFRNTAGDGLNTATLRYLRGRRGAENAVNGIVGIDPFSNRKNINVKIDQHIGSHRISGNWSYQVDDNVQNLGAWPDAINGTQFLRPTVVTINATSTLGPTLLNEARWGMNYNDRAELPAWRSSNDEVREAAESFFLQGGAATNGSIYPVIPSLIATVGAGTAARTVNGAGKLTTNAIRNIANTTVLYNYADTVSWTHGKHAFKFGADLDFSRSNGLNLQSIPTVSFGNNASATSTVSPFTTLTNFSTQLPLLRSNSRNLVAALSYFLNGSVSQANHSYWMENQVDKDTGIWQDYATRGQRYRNQISSDYAFFAKDDYKLTSRLTLNLGVRYTVLKSPFLKSGLTSAPLGLGDGLFGASRGAGGQLFDNWLQPGNVFLTGYGSNPGTPLDCQSGVTQSALLPVSTCDPNLLTNLEFIGPNTANPGKVAIPNDWNNFAPNIGFAYQAPWFGGSGVTIRGGYGITYGSVGRNGIAIDTLLGSAPGNTLTATTSVTDASIQAILATRALNLTDVPILVPVTPLRGPGDTVPIYARSTSFTAYDPNFATPYTQNITLSLTRQVNRQLTLDLRYIGTLARKQQGSLNLNESTVFYNPELFDALERTRRGEDVELFDLMFAGLNLAPTGTAGYGAVGTVVSGVLQRGSAHLRRNTTVNDELANGNFESVANQLVTLVATSGHQALPANPATGQALTNVTQRVLRNGCDRLANGLTTIPTRCFPENYLQANPQFNNANYNANLNHSNYHSLQFQATVRPSLGISLQATWVWAKSMELNDDNDFGNPLFRDLDYQKGLEGAHSLRMNGTVELPIGPNKLLFGSTSGWVARILERWQTGFILNLATGSPATVTGAGNMLYGAGRMNVTPYWKIPKGDLSWDRFIPATGQTAGNWYGFPSPFVSVLDPQCTDSSLVVQTDNRGYNFGANCTLDALGIVVPAGTPDSQTLGTTSYVLGLVNPTPGNFGNLGPRTLGDQGQFSLDANISKTFRVSESKSLQVRIDTRNVLNHPNPGNIDFSIDNLGNINTKTGSRTFQGQLRLTF